MNVPEIIKSVCDKISYTAAIDFIIFQTGILLFGAWLLKTSLGRKSLSDSVPRRNNMPPYLPFVPLFMWVGTASLATSIKEALLPDPSGGKNAFLDNLILCTAAIIGTAVIIVLARASFARRLKGFGLNLKTTLKDIPAAFLNLLTVWPLVVAMIMLTMHLGELVWGPDFQIQPHEELELIKTYPQTALRLLIIVTAVTIVPVFEEMLFRGLFQTMLRSILRKPWQAIATSSCLFALAHANPGHWPALFALSLCLGYALEKSGSLLRPIFIHALFNAAGIIGTLYNI
jgi:membrane protease YdiL (CAAX protease family)